MVVTAPPPALDPPIARLRGRARVAAAVLVLSVLVPYGVIGERPFFLWQVLGDLRAEAAVAAVAPAALGIALAIATAVCRDALTLAVAVAGSIASALVATSLGATAAPWDLLPVPESFTHAAAAPIFAIALAVAATMANEHPALRASIPKLILCAGVLIAFYYFLPVLGEPPIGTAARVLTQVARWPGWRSRLGAVLLALFLSWPAFAIWLASRQLRVRATSPLGLAALAVTLIAVLYRSLIGLEGEAGVLTTAASIVVLVTLVIILATAIVTLLRSGIESARWPGRQAIATVLAVICAVAALQLGLGRRETKGVAWRLGASSDEADRLFGTLVPAWNDEHALSDFYYQRSADPSRLGVEIAASARAVHADLAPAFEALVLSGDLSHLPSLRWDHLVADLNEASRRAALPYYVDPTAEVLVDAHGFRRWFRLDTYRIERVCRHRLSGRELTTLHMRYLTPSRGGPASLGMSRDTQPYALVVLDQIEAYAGQLERLAAADPPRCADDPRLAPDDPALGLCAALVEEIVSGHAPHAALLEAVERHELQHQLDGPALRHSRVVLQRLGYLDRGEQAKVDRELSAYLAQATVAPRLTLLRLFQLAIAQRGALERAVAFFALETLAERSAGDVRGAADAFTDLARLPEAQIRARARRAHETLFGGAPITPAELVGCEPHAARSGVAAARAGGAPIIAPARLAPVGAVDERYQSYNVEMREVTGGRFWKPYGSSSAPRPKPPESDAGDTPSGMAPDLYEYRPPIDLGNPRLRTLAAALGPAYVRVSGTWANTTYLAPSDPAPTTPPAGFMGVLTRPEWKGVVDFARAVDAKIVTSFAVGNGTRDASGAWTPVQALPFVQYTRSLGGSIAAAEFMNEPNLARLGGAPAGYDAAAYGRDFKAFVAFAKKADPSMLIVGPGSSGETDRDDGASGKIRTRDMLAASGRALDAFSYHHYGACSLRCAPMGLPQTSASAALTEGWLTRTDVSLAYYRTLRDELEPGAPIWLTETADAACGGNPWARTFLDTFRYLDQLGRLARQGVRVVMHNTLVASDYGLLDDKTLAPKPNYWGAVLWRRLMGTTVLDSGVPIGPGLHVYAHCLRAVAGGVALLAINTDTSRAHQLAIPTASERYTLSASSLESTVVRLNDAPLALDRTGAIPAVASVPAPSGTVSFAPATITFLAVPAAGNPGCRAGIERLDGPGILSPEERP